jgi:transcriptional regulator GlxA family with amidase domain
VAKKKKKKKKKKKAAATGTKVPMPDEVPVADRFDYTAGENKDIFDASVQTVRDFPGQAMQQQAWEWLSTNLTNMMNQLRNGNVRNNSAKRAELERLQENLETNGWKKRTTGCLTEWFLFPPDGAGGTSLSITKTNKAIE